MEPPIEQSPVAKNELRALIQNAISTAVGSGLEIDRLRGVAFFDTAKDAPIIALSSYAAAIA
jgi:hypothetical protein